MKKYLFYDVETSGLNPAFDQILTFACIFTDTNLKELQRKTVTVKPRPDIVPSPHAFITHRLLPSKLEEEGCCEHEAAREIHSLLNTPDTQNIGYNSLGFDDAFLRFLFYRNLLDPYSHQYASGCSRGDILPLAALYRVFAEDVMDWPVLEGGTPTLKLEHISRINQFETSGKAHEAMADVEALVELTRAFAGKSEMWSYAMGFFDKKTDAARMEALDRTCEIDGRPYQVGIMVSPSFGAKSGYLAPVLRIGDSIPYKNQTLWLRLDQPDLLAQDDGSGLFRWFVIRKRPGDEWITLPCKKRFWERIHAVAREQVSQNIKGFQSQTSMFGRTVQHHVSYAYPDIPHMDADAALYRDGFFTFGEKKDIARFFASSTKFEKFAVVKKITQPRIENIVRRILARNYVQEPGMTLPNGYVHHVRRVFSNDPEQGDVVGYKGDAKYSLWQFRQHMEGLQTEEAAKELDDEQVAVLEELKAHVKALSSLWREVALVRQSGRCE